MPLKRVQRGKEGGQGKKRELGKGEGKRNIVMARWLLRHIGDTLGSW